MFAVSGIGIGSDDGADSGHRRHNDDYVDNAHDDPRAHQYQRSPPSMPRMNSPSLHGAHRTSSPRSHDHNTSTTPLSPSPLPQANSRASNSRPLSAHAHAGYSGLHSPFGVSSHYTNNSGHALAQFPVTQSNFNPSMTAMMHNAQHNFTDSAPLVSRKAQMKPSSSSSDIRSKNHSKAKTRATASASESDDDEEKDDSSSDDSSDDSSQRPRSTSSKVSKKKQKDKERRRKEKKDRDRDDNSNGGNNANKKRNKQNVKERTKNDTDTAHNNSNSRREVSDKTTKNNKRKSDEVKDSGGGGSGSNKTAKKNKSDPAKSKKEKSKKDRKSHASSSSDDEMDDAVDMDKFSASSSKKHHGGNDLLNEYTSFDAAMAPSLPSADDSHASNNQQHSDWGDHDFTFTSPPATSVHPSFLLDEQMSHFDMGNVDDSILQTHSSTSEHWNDFLSNDLNPAAYSSLAAHHTSAIAPASSSNMLYSQPTTPRPPNDESGAHTDEHSLSALSTMPQQQMEQRTGASAWDRQQRMAPLHSAPSRIKTESADVFAVPPQVNTALRETSPPHSVQLKQRSSTSRNAADADASYTGDDDFGANHLRLPHDHSLHPHSAPSHDVHRRPVFDFDRPYISQHESSDDLDHNERSERASALARSMHHASSTVQLSEHANRNAVPTSSGALGQHSHSAPQLSPSSADSSRAQTSERSPKREMTAPSNLPDFSALQAMEAERVRQLQQMNRQQSARSNAQLSPHQTMLPRHARVSSAANISGDPITPRTPGALLDSVSLSSLVASLTKRGNESNNRDLRHLERMVANDPTLLTQVLTHLARKTSEHNDGDHKHENTNGSERLGSTDAPRRGHSRTMSSQAVMTPHSDAAMFPGVSPSASASPTASSPEWRSMQTAMANANLSALQQQQAWLNHHNKANSQTQSFQNAQSPSYARQGRGGAAGTPTPTTPHSPAPAQSSAAAAIINNQMAQMALMQQQQQHAAAAAAASQQHQLALFQQLNPRMQRSHSSNALNAHSPSAEARSVESSAHSPNPAQTSPTSGNVHLMNGQINLLKRDAGLIQREMQYLQFKAQQAALTHYATQQSSASRPATAESNAFMQQSAQQYQQFQMQLTQRHQQLLIKAQQTMQQIHQTEDQLADYLAHSTHSQSAQLASIMATTPTASTPVGSDNKARGDKMKKRSTSHNNLTALVPNGPLTPTPPSNASLHHTAPSPITPKSGTLTAPAAAMMAMNSANPTSPSYNVRSHNNMNGLANMNGMSMAAAAAAIGGLNSMAALGGNPKNLLMRNPALTLQQMQLMQFQRAQAAQHAQAQAQAQLQLQQFAHLQQLAGAGDRSAAASADPSAPKTRRRPTKPAPTLDVVNASAEATADTTNSLPSPLTTVAGVPPFSPSRNGTSPMISQRQSLQPALSMPIPPYPTSQSPRHIHLPTNNADEPTEAHQNAADVASHSHTAASASVLSPSRENQMRTSPQPINAANTNDQNETQQT